MYAYEYKFQQRHTNMNNPFDKGFYTEGDLQSSGFRRLGKNIQIAKNATLIGLDNITIGDNVRIDDYCTIVAVGGHVHIGSYIHIASGCHIAGGGGVTMHDFSGLSQGTKIYSVTDDYSGAALTNPTVSSEYTNAQSAPVTIGKHSIVGAGSIILPGVTLDEGCAIGSLSLVTKNLDAWGIYIGSPAKFLKARSKDLLQKEKDFLEGQNT